MAPRHNRGPRLLLSHREGALLLERARVHVDGDRLVYHAADDDLVRRYNIPHANLAVLFLGQGTSITQDAARLLAEEGVFVAFTGTGGTPLHFGSLTAYQSTHHLRRLLPIYLDESRSLAAAIAIMSRRIDAVRTIGIDLAEEWMGARKVDEIERACDTFEKALSSCRGAEPLLGLEGIFARNLYSAFAKIAKVVDFSRAPGSTADKQATTDPTALINSLIDHGNYLAYGTAGACLWTLGIPSSLSLLHGKTRAGGLVFDIADSFKDAVVLPAAFAAACGKRTDAPEKQFRARVIDTMDERKLLKRTFETIEIIIEAGAR